jgi:CheY-like chemotaxis protein
VQQLIQIASPDLVILDLHLARGQSGLDVLAWLRQHQAATATAVSIVSGDVPLLHTLAQTFDAHHCDKYLIAASRFHTTVGRLHASYLTCGLP